MRVTVLGLGAMGRAFASRALAGGHEVVVWNRSAGRGGELVATGAREASSVVDAVAGCEVAIVVVSDDAAVRDVVGALGSALPAGAVLVNGSTTAPEVAVEVARLVSAERFVEAPVMGSPDAVEGGRGRFLVSGVRATVDRLGPLWSDLGADARWCGPHGNASVMKILSNTLMIVGVAALGEAIAVARGRGIADDLLREVFSDSAVISPAQRLRLESLMSADHPGWFAPALALKDLRLGLGLGEPESLRVAPAAAESLRQVAGEPWPDVSAVIEAVRPPAGDLDRLARLLRDRDALDGRIAAVAGGADVGDFLAGQVFDIELVGRDGVFGSGPLKGRTVTVMMYADMAGGMDISENHSDFYLVLTGPSHSGAWRLASVHLFDTSALRGDLTTRGVENDVDTSLSQADIEDARIYPHPNPRAPLRLTDRQREQLALFRP